MYVRVDHTSLQGRIASEVSLAKRQLPLTVSNSEAEKQKVNERSKNTAGDRCLSPAAKGRITLPCNCPLAEAAPTD